MQNFTSLIADGNRLSQPAAHRLRPLPGVSEPTYIDQQSLVGSACSVGTTTRNFLDELDQGCLVSNIHCHTDRRAHIVNAQRSNTSEKGEVVCWKNASKTWI
jgi:hypothetical protein